MVELTFYHRMGCHLCDQMLQEIEVIRATHEFQLIRVDIDRSEQLREAYGIRIPCLEGPGGELLSEHFLDRSRFLSYLRGV